MRKLLLLILLLLLNLMPFLAKASPMDEMQTFYQHKDESLAKAIIQDISDKQVLEKIIPHLHL